MGFIGGQELLLILLILLVLFGAKKIPELAKGLGTGLKEFKKATKDVETLPGAVDQEKSKKVENHS